MLYINVTSIDPFFPPSPDQYRVPEYPDVQIKPRRGTADGVNKARGGGGRQIVDIKAKFDFLSPRPLLDTLTCA